MKYLFIILILLLSVDLQAQTFANVKKIVIDAGHGGKDSGASHNGINEKDLNLEYAIALKSKINEENPKVKVILTRKKDVYVKLSKRTKIANKKKVDLFIAIHANAAENLLATGTETYVFSKNSEAYSLAIAIESEYKKNTALKSRGVKINEKLYVLKNTNMPAVLTEIGFLSNAEDAKYLQTDECKTAIIQSIYNAIFAESSK